jgi:hypothetical protein
MRRKVLAIALAALVAVDTSALAYTLIRPAKNPQQPLRWPEGAQPVVMRLNDQIGPGLPNLATGSDPLGAIQRSLAKYPAASSVQVQSGSTAIASVGMDGVNIISFADTTDNRSAFEMAGGDAVIGLTISFFADSDLVEADLLFNPAVQFTTVLSTDAALQDANEVDVEAVATHELGHVIGLHHTGVESATMWPLSSVLQRTLDADDIAGARTLYPPGSGRGAVQGRVMLGADGAFGAHVVAVDPSGVLAASALTLLDGSYAIEQLPPATYRVYVEPLDGPQSVPPYPAAPCIDLGNLSGAGIYSQSTLDTDFVTHSDDNVVVTADHITMHNFSLPHSKPTLNPVQIGPAVVPGDGSFSASISGVALGVTAGSTQWVAVAGPGIAQVPVAGVDFGPGITVDSTIDPGPFTCNGSPLPTMLLRITVDPSAPVGGRAIGFVNENQRAEFTGAVRIVATGPTPTSLPVSTTTPLPTGSPTRTQTSAPTNTPTGMATSGPSDTPTRPGCVGDCDDSGRVAVDELVKGVNIALANADLSTCSAFDANGDHKVTVDELVQAVNAALNGCPT